MSPPKGPGLLDLVFFGVATLGLIPAVFYLDALRRALAACAPARRTLDPRLVWLQLVAMALATPSLVIAPLLGPGAARALLLVSVIPGLFGIVWQFVIVIAVSRSLGAELRARGIPADPSPALGLGLWTAALGPVTVLTWKPLVILFGIPCLVVWLLYWIRIVGTRRLLDGVAPPPAVPVSP